MNIREAREIVSELKHLERAIKDDRLYTPVQLKVQDYIEARGYLAAIDGPEVRALVEALEHIRRHCDPAALNGSAGVADKALMAFREAVGK